MTSFQRLRTLFVAVALVGAPAACNKDSTGKSADKSAAHVNDRAKDMTDQAVVVSKLHDAQHDFAYDRAVRVATLRGVHALAAEQTGLISALANGFPLVPADGTLVTEHLQILQMRIDDAGNQIEALSSVDAASWTARHDIVNKAMDRVEEARKDAWKALHAAKRIDRTSMR